MLTELTRSLNKFDLHFLHVPLAIASISHMRSWLSDINWQTVRIDGLFHRVEATACLVVACLAIDTFFPAPLRPCPLLLPAMCLPLGNLAILRVLKVALERC